MADRSDDIKQLFSHLGLNPGDYQEMREKTRALSRSAEDAPALPGASTRHAPEPAAKPPQAATQATAVPPTVRLNPLITRQPASGGEASQRWPLLKAAVETPTRVAARPGAGAAETPEPAVPSVAPTPTPVLAQAPVVERPAAAAQAAPAPASTKPLGSTSEVATLLKAVEQAKALERAESDAIERTTRRVVEELQRNRVPTPRAAESENASAPAPAPARAPAAGIPVRSASNAQIAAAATDAQAPRTGLFQNPKAYSPRAGTLAAPMAAADSKPAAEGDVQSTPAVVPGSELQSAFQRLADPERVPQQRFSRLKFNYGASETPSKPKKLKEENLEDVFSRISGPPKSR